MDDLNDVFNAVFSQASIQQLLEKIGNQSMRSHFQYLSNNPANESSPNVSEKYANSAELNLSFTPSLLVFILIIALTISGNILVIVAFTRVPALQAVTNYWIISLSFTDLILATTVMPMNTFVELNQGRWMLGQLGCNILISLDVLCCTCSIYHLLLISLDRFLCVKYPFHYPQKRSKSMALIAIAGTWILCWFISMPSLIGWTVHTKDIDECAMDNATYMIASSVTSFYLPLIVIIAMYIGIYRSTRKQTAKMLASQGLNSLGEDSQRFSSSRRTVRTSISLSAISGIGGVLNPAQRDLVAEMSPTPALAATTVVFSGAINAAGKFVVSMEPSSGMSKASEFKQSGKSLRRSSSCRMSGRSTGSPTLVQKPILQNVPKLENHIEVDDDDEDSGIQDSPTATLTLQSELSEELKIQLCQSIALLATIHPNIIGAPKPGVLTPSRLSPRTPQRGSTSTSSTNGPSTFDMIDAQVYKSINRSLEVPDDEAELLRSMMAKKGCRRGRRFKPLRYNKKKSSNVSTSPHSKSGHQNRGLVSCHSITGISDTSSYYKQSWSTRLRSYVTGIKQRSSEQHSIESIEEFSPVVVNRLRRNRQRQEQRAARIVVVILAVFIVFWTPFFAVNVIDPTIHPVSRDVWKLVTWFGYANSCVNPFLYTFFNRTFRRAIKSLLGFSGRTKKPFLNNKLKLPLDAAC